MEERTHFRSTGNTFLFVDADKKRCPREPSHLRVAHLIPLTAGHDDLKRLEGLG
jgi:hypothetical protein